MKTTYNSAQPLRLRKQTIVKYNTVRNAGQGKSDPTIGTFSTITVFLTR
jgi:hypothetical protein